MRQSPVLKWQIISGVLAIVLLTVGSLLWAERNYLIFQVTNRNVVSPLNEAGFVRRTETMLGQIGAITAVLRSVDLAHNIRETLVYQTKTGRVKNNEGRKAPLFTTDPEENEFATFMVVGRTHCGPLVTRTFVGQRLLDDGVTFICRAPIITSKKILIGYVKFGFKERPLDVELPPIVQKIEQLAQDMPIAQS